MGSLVPVAELPFAYSEPKTSLYLAYFKRFFDVLFASVILIWATPIVALVAFLISLDGHGSPIYRQERVGTHGKAFTLYKLRTMVKNMERHGYRTEEGDFRITFLGKFLRDVKIDELPQLWNIIRGDMSIIGPRPLSVHETDHLREKFSDDHPGFLPKVMPGLTGLEQCYRTVVLPYEERFRINHYYETHYGWWLDLWIFRKSLFVCPFVCALTAIVGLGELIALALPYMRQIPFR